MTEAQVGSNCTPANPFATMPRQKVEAIIEAAIRHLDIIDGDSDLENYDCDEEDDCPDFCEAGDDGCGPLLRQGLVCWGSERDEEGY